MDERVEDKILIADDESEIVRLLKRFMQSAGFKVYSAMDAQEAVAKTRDLRPDAVLLDIVMPGGGGIEALKEIKRIQPTTAVIMITAVVGDEMMHISLQAGADGYIRKPCALSELEETVRDAIKKYRQ